MNRKQKYFYSFLTSPVDSLITNTIINANVHLLEHHLNILEYGVFQYAISFYLIKKNKLFGSFVAAYQNLNQLRAIIYWNGLHSQQFFGFELTTYDPYFLIPIGVGILNYYLVKSSDFPQLMRLSKDQNKLKLINICFMSSLAFCGLPVDVTMVYLSMGGCQLLYQLWKKYKRSQALRNSQINI